MRICVDIDCLYTAKTGVRTYVTELIMALRRQGVTVIELRRSPKSLSVRLQRSSRLALHLGRILWVHLLLPIKLMRVRGDILLSPEYFTPLFSPKPNYVTVHDTVFFTRKQEYGLLFRILFRLFAIPAIKRATRILTVSEHAKGEIGRLLELESNRITVTYLGIKGSDTLSEVKPPNHPSAPYFIYVGVLEKRKNIVRAIKAFSKFHLTHPNVKFYIVGQSAPFPSIDATAEIRAEITALKLEDSVYLTGFLPEDELREIYRGALALVFVSLFEGFGLPIIEAFAHGLPVITSKGAATEEVAGDCAILCDPLDTDDIFQSMCLVANNNSYRQSLIEAGLSRAGLFTWDDAARRLINEVDATYL